MKFVGLVICLGLFGGVCLAQRYPCLQSGVTTDRAVNYVNVTSPTGQNSTSKITVGQTLKKLKAKCSRNKLVDGKRKPIYFFDMQGCWGNPPADYREILEQQSEQIKGLKKKYTVIEMTCKTDGMQQQPL